MTPSPEAEWEAVRDRVRMLLDAAASQSRRILFWWRDDDAVDVTPRLERLQALAARHRLPLAVAVIPEPATQALADRLARDPGVRVLQHGWRHKRHSPPSEKKMELGDHRPLPQILAELRAGYERLKALFGPSFLPVLVPPWNRIGRNVNSARRSVGLTGLSMFGPKQFGGAGQVNTHLDIMDWSTRGSRPRADLYALLCRELERRLQGDPAPIGILSHHLIHREESWDMLDEMFGLLRQHPGAEWPAIEPLFSLAQERDAPRSISSGSQRASHA